MKLYAWQADTQALRQNTAPNQRITIYALFIEKPTRYGGLLPLQPYAQKIGKQVGRAAECTASFSDSIVTHRVIHRSWGGGRPECFDW